MGSKVREGEFIKEICSLERVLVETKDEVIKTINFSLPQSYYTSTQQPQPIYPLV